MPKSNSNLYRSGNPNVHERRKLRSKRTLSRAGAESLGIRSLLKQIYYDLTEATPNQYREFDRRYKEAKKRSKR